MTTTIDNPIQVETIKGKEFFHRKDDFHELVFHFYNGSKNYPDLGAEPFYEEWEFEEVGSELEDCHRDMETIHLPLLLNDEGDELEIEQVIELYGINPIHVENSCRYLESFEEEMWTWNNGERNELPG